MTTISANLQAVKSRIVVAKQTAGRDADEVQLLAVSKSWPASCVREAMLAGQIRFGESYVQEAVAKIAELRDCQLEWHFIGPLQSNKTAHVAENFSWVHSIDREKVAARLAAQRPENLPPLQVLIQVNVSGEASKSGVAPHEVMALARIIDRLPRLTLRGLMAIPEATPDASLARSRFRLLRELLDAANLQGLALDTLSMGMSDDLEAAIMEGATIVRVGSAIFGARVYNAAKE